MTEQILIYGKIGCPHTNRARAAIEDHRFIDVLENPANLEEMLQLSDGKRRVPVIVSGKEVSVGFNGGS